MWKYRDVKPEYKIPLTRKQKLQNWWLYHWGWLPLGIILLIFAADLLLHALGFGIVEPDYQAAYIASIPVSETDIASLEGFLASLGEDCNGDGRIVVRINSYVDMSVSGETAALSYATAAQVRLMADMESCESYFIFCDNPKKIQENYQILARADGTLAGTGDAPLAVSWADLVPEEVFPLPLSGLFLTRRGFWQDRSCRYRPQCDALWEKLTKGVVP